MSDIERNNDGSMRLRHGKAAEPAQEVSYADAERIENHISEHLGEGMVFHEIVSDRFHNDVHMIPPSEKFPFNILVTCGMSALPMTLPEEMPGRENWTYAELCIILPPDWKLDPEGFSDERNYWPVRLLKDLARLPHDYSTWLGYGHTVPNGNPAEPYAPETGLAGAVIVPPLLLGDGFFTIPGEPPVHIFQVIPVTAEELEYKLENGIDALLELLETNIGDEVFAAVDPGRKSAVN